RKSVGDFFPAEWRQRETVESVRNTTCFLRTDEVHIYVARVFVSLADGGACNFVEHHPLYRFLRRKYLDEVPGNAFPFAVFVGREVDFRGFLHLAFELVNYLCLALRRYVEGCEVIVDINSKSRPGQRLVFCRHIGSCLGEVPHVAHAGFHYKVYGEKFGYGTSLRGRLDNYQDFFRHIPPYLANIDCSVNISSIFRRNDCPENISVQMQIHRPASRARRDSSSPRKPRPATRQQPQQGST